LNDLIDIKRKYIPRVYSSIRLAKEYNVSPGLIYHIKNGKNWKHTVIGDECENLKRLKKNYPVKLTEKDVREIRRRYAKGERVTDLAKFFNVNTTMISRIKNEKAWRHIL